MTTAFRRGVALSMLLVLLAVQVAFAREPGRDQREAPWSTPAMSIRDVLKADGTLDTARARGSIDARGYLMVAGPNGEPRFVDSQAPLAAGDEKWDDRFGFPGVEGTVNAIAVSGDDIYSRRQPSKGGCRSIWFDPAVGWAPLA